MTTLRPDEPNGVLLDARGRVAYRFGEFATGEEHEIPAYIDGFHGVEYAESPAPGKALGRPLEADPERDDLPDPTPPDGANARPRPKGVGNPQSDAFRGTRT